MTEFAYNNIINANTSHNPFKLNCGYNPKVSFKEDVDSCSKSRFTNKLAKEFRELLKVCYQNLLYAQKLQKKVYDKGVKNCSYAPDEKVWLNCKYIKQRGIKNLKISFLDLFKSSIQ